MFLKFSLSPSDFPHFIFCADYKTPEGELAKRDWKTEKKEEEGLLLILPSLSPRPPLHRLFPPPPPFFFLCSILSRLPFFPVRQNEACATILEQCWHEMEVGRTASAGNTPNQLRPPSCIFPLAPSRLSILSSSAYPSPLPSSPAVYSLCFNHLGYVG